MDKISMRDYLKARRDWKGSLRRVAAATAKLTAEEEKLKELHEVVREEDVAVLQLNEMLFRVQQLRQGVEDAIAKHYAISARWQDMYQKVAMDKTMEIVTEEEMV